MPDILKLYETYTANMARYPARPIIFGVMRDE